MLIILSGKTNRLNNIVCVAYKDTQKNSGVCLFCPFGILVIQRYVMGIKEVFQYSLSAFATAGINLLQWVCSTL